MWDGSTDCCFVLLFNRLADKFEMAAYSETGYGNRAMAAIVGTGFDEERLAGFENRFLFVHQGDGVGLEI